MNESPASSVAQADLLSKVGSLIFYWSMMEQELTSAIVRLRKCVGAPPARVRGTLAERLDLWAELAGKCEQTSPYFQQVQRAREQALEIREIRNHIVHGLQVARGGWPREDVYVRCVIGGYENPSGETVTYSLDDLHHLTESIDACRRAFIYPRNFNYEVKLPVGRRQASSN